MDPQAKANPTDPDSGIMKTAKGWVQGYNAQAMVSEDQIIIAGALTQDANDVRQLGPMVTAALVNLEMVSGQDVELGAVLADRVPQRRILAAGPATRRPASDSGRMVRCPT